MTVTLVAAPLLLALLVARLAPRWAAALPPAAAVRLLTMLALVASLASGLSLSVLGLFWVGQLSPVAAAGQWSASFLRHVAPAPSPVLTLAGATAALLMLVGAHRAVRSLLTLVATERQCRRLGGSGRLVVVQDDDADAYALPGLRGRIVVSSAMLRALPADERRVLLAHETAHLRHRHHLYLLVTGLAVAANPVLRPLRQAVRLGVERWADEDAATVTGDRELVARSLARAGLARAGSRRGAVLGALGLTETELGARTAALLRPAPRRALWQSSGLAAGVVLLLVVGVALGAWTQHVFELAEIARPR